ncbi:hypothetical protein NHX12_003615 [Muraenolepis orangiensis]|uniref:Uncharacterized protein n=1 Tax=Muraenolepis orangiensis TaxID=630683 RepID=A0A9Q0DTW8_9TELE|nr:hypothetical protein NHX12_003615 [Muraenolepis orangiensis]
MTGCWTADAHGWCGPRYPPYNPEQIDSPGDQRPMQYGLSYGASYKNQHLHDAMLLLEVSPGGFSWRFLLEATPGGFSWRFLLEVSPGGFSWRFLLEVSPGGFSPFGGVSLGVCLRQGWS